MAVFSWVLSWYSGIWAMVMEVVLEFLGGMPLFSKLSEAFSLSLARECRFTHMEKGEILFFQSDPSEAAYVVRTGIISIILNSPDGREMVINEMHGGGFGEDEDDKDKKKSDDGKDGKKDEKPSKKQVAQCS